jgi:hypothetical protein
MAMGMLGKLTEGTYMARILGFSESLSGTRAGNRAESGFAGQNRNFAAFAIIRS